MHVSSVPKGAIDAVPEGGAGGPMGFTGDYLFRDGRNPFFEGGLWGILRVKPKAEGPALRVNVMGSLSAVPFDVRGATIEPLSVSSPDGICTIRLPGGTMLAPPAGALDRQIVAHWNLDPPPAPPGTEVVLAMNLGPKELVITPEAELVMQYSSLKLPAGASEGDLFIAELEGDTWEEAPSKVDLVARTVTARLDGLDMYALMVRVPLTSAAGPSLQQAPAVEAAAPAAGTNWWLIVGAGAAVAGALALAVYSVRRKKATSG